MISSRVVTFLPARTEREDAENGVVGVDLFILQVGM
jgi:hypothetical protein